MKSSLGIKLDQFPTESKRISQLKKLCRHIDFLEYQAPILGFEQFHQDLHIDAQSFRPHSVKLSTATPILPPISILKLLKRQCRETKAPYLGEHIGFLNPNFNGPSLGYVFPPALTNETIAMVAKNVRIIQDYVEVPLALENPSFYVEPSGTDKTWGQFIETLSKELPKETGWLIDWAHLIVSNRNLNNSSLHDTLTAYQRTGRPIYEIHLAAISDDRHGVTHDNHHEVLELKGLEDAFTSLKTAKIHPQSFTLEKDAPDNYEDLIPQTTMLRKALISTEKTSLRAVGQEKLLPPTGRPNTFIRAEREKVGRLKILSNVIKEQFVIDADIFESLAAAYKFDSFQELVKLFSQNLHAEYFKKSLPYYEIDDRDNVDLTACFYDFLNNLPNSQGYTTNLRRELLVALASKHAAVLALRERDGKIKSTVLLNLKERSETLPAGSFRLRVNTSNQIIAEVASINSAADFVFLDQGGPQWLKLRKQKRAKLEKLSISSNNRRIPSPEKRQVTILTNQIQMGERAGS